MHETESLKYIIQQKQWHKQKLKIKLEIRVLTIFEVVDEEILDLEQLLETEN